MRIAGLFFALLISVLYLSPARAQQPDKKVFIADLNGNRKPDRIVEVKYKKRVILPSRTADDKCESTVGHFARYVLYLDNQKRGRMIFDYMYGDADADYWTFGIKKAVDLNKDGVKDLIFYAGDDTSQEYVFLIQKPDYFKAVYPGVFELYEFPELNESNNITVKPDNSSRQILAKWNPRREVFESGKIKWVTRNCVGMRAKPNGKSKLLYAIEAGANYETSNRKNDRQNGWQKIKLPTAGGEIEGWIETRYLSAISPTKKFPLR